MPLKIHLGLSKVPTDSSIEPQIKTQSFGGSAEQAKDTPAQVRERGQAKGTAEVYPFFKTE